MNLLGKGGKTEWRTTVVKLWYFRESSKYLQFTGFDENKTKMSWNWKIFNESGVRKCECIEGEGEFEFVTPVDEWHAH